MARGLGLRGTVQNLPDRSVELRLVGDSELIHSLLASLKASFEIESVEESPLPDAFETEGTFEILR